MKKLSIAALCVVLAGGATFAQVPGSTTPLAPGVPPAGTPRTPLPPVPPETLPVVPPKAAPKSTVAVTVTDASITAKVRDAISSDPDLKGLSVTVETTEAVVTLNGTADSSDQIARALSLARAVDGVKSVTNILAVKSS